MRSTVTSAPEFETSDLRQGSDPREPHYGPDYETADSPTVRGVAREALRGKLPPRYGENWFTRVFLSELDALLRPGQQILDVGSGATATVAPHHRPKGSRYVGLDISADELQRAELASYDETVVADVTDFQPALEEQFDLILSFQVLEHVKPLPVAFENMRMYLRPGGVMVHRFSAARSAGSLLNRALPTGLGVFLETKLRGRNPETMFPAIYDHCTYTELEQILKPFARHRIETEYIGASYFEFLRPLMAAYLLYEEQIYRRARHNLGTFYVVTAYR